MLRAFIISFLLASLVLPVQAAQMCDASKAATAPMSRFKENATGTITDTQSKRVWLRCALGMSWNGSTCEGQTLTYDWRSANAAIDELNAKKIGGHKNWRLPSVTELQGIVESQCFKPAINLDAFPYSPESGFWTKTEAPGIKPRAMIVHFIHGQDYVANKNQSWRVRPIADK